MRVTTVFDTITQPYWTTYVLILNEYLYTAGTGM